MTPSPQSTAAGVFDPSLPGGWPSNTANKTDRPPLLDTVDGMAGVEEEKMSETTKKPKAKKRGKWVFVPATEQTPEQIRAEKVEYVTNMLGIASGVLSADPSLRFAAAEQFQDYFPGDNEVPEGGAWILVKKSPNTEYTVPPLSLWFAEPWPMEGKSIALPHRVRVVTPRGHLGLFPREYSLIGNPERYYEFFGGGMTVHFFGGDLAGVPEPALFYLRSRGVSKGDALKLLIGRIKGHGIMWVETDREVAKTYVRDGDWPDESRLATSANFTAKVQAGVTAKEGKHHE
jgi:hypothetical protein